MSGPLRRLMSPVVAAVLAVAARLDASPRPPPPRPLPAPPVIPRVVVEVARDHVMIVEDVVFGRGGATGGDLDLYVSFGAPGVPRAVDAFVAPDADQEDDLGRAERLTLDRAPQRPASARPLLGPSGMAGVVLHLREAAFRWATQPSGALRLRIRTLLDLPPVDASGSHEIVVRLGAHEGEPDPLDRIELRSQDPRPWLSSASARLCGPDSTSPPLALRPLGRGWGRLEGGTLDPTAVAPSLTVRHATESLCVRFATAP